MIISFGNFEKEKVWLGNRVKKLPLEVQNIGRKKLRMLNNSINIANLRIPPANRLEKLSGKFKEFYSIKINAQWRIIFNWKAGNAFEVEIIDFQKRTNRENNTRIYKSTQFKSCLTNAYNCGFRC